MHELSKVEIISILINDDIRDGDDIGNLILNVYKLIKFHIVNFISNLSRVNIFSKIRVEII